MYTAKHAMLYKHRVPQGQAYVFYMDIRSGGKNYEEFVQRAVEEDEVMYIRGRVSRMYRDDGKIVVVGADTLSGTNVEVRADMVVLAMAMRPSKGLEDIVKKLKIQTDPNGFLAEAHPKLRPVDAPTPGIFFAGCVEAPKDIKDSVTQAGAAVARSSILLNAGTVTGDAIKAVVDLDKCTSCGVCAKVCPYNAITVDVKAKSGARIIAAACAGCGACAAECRFNAIQIQNFEDQQVLAQISAALDEISYRSPPDTMFSMPTPENAPNSARSTTAAKPSKGISTPA